MKTMMTVEEASRLIAEKRPLLIGGDEAQLAKLPRGSWIGGTTPYFMAEDGGRVTRDLVQVHAFPDFVTVDSIRVHAAEALPSIPAHYPAHGFSVVLVPGFSDTHRAFAEGSFAYEGVFDSPLVGWVTGFHLDDLGTVSAKVFDGQSGEVHADAAVVMHLRVPDDVTVRSNILNLFTQSSGATIVFDGVGFDVTEALVDGERTNLAAWVTEKGIDTRLPLVADYQGAMVNVSFQSVDEAAGTVRFYAPVFPGVPYRIAREVADYGDDFQRALDARKAQPAWSCNCILNFLYAGLEGKKTGDVVGPITFGEIAYILLNQTMVYLTFEATA